MEEQCLVMWLNIMVNEGFIKQYDSDTVKCLTLVSRYFANTLKNYIQQNYWFDLSSESGRRLTYYTPVNQKEVTDINEIMPETKKVKFHSHFNKEVDTLLSLHITHLKLGWDFNTNIDHLLLPNLVYIKFSHFFDSFIQSLPPSIEIIKFGDFYNRSVDHVLPPNLKILQFGYYFDTRIQSLPPKLEKCTFGREYSHPVNHLSNQIKFLRRAFDFKKHVYVITPYQYEPM